MLIDFAVFFTSELIDRVIFFFVTLLKIGTKKYLHLTGGLAQAGQWLARKFVRIWKFIARPSVSESPACAKPLGR